MRRRPALLAVVTFGALCCLPAGCGGRFDLPTETPRGQSVPSDSAYAAIATWTGMDSVQDLLLTQGLGNQLFALFNHGGTGGPSVPRGEVRLYPLTRPVPIGAPYFDALRGLFNPVAIAAGQNQLFVLDQGDSCQAKFDVRTGTCRPDVDSTRIANGNPFRNQIFEYAATWRVRAYGLGGGETLSTFTDTTMAQPWGISADDQGRVYVSGLAVVLDTLQTDQRIRTRKYVSRVYRYVPGPAPPGSADGFMPGTDAWHRDETWRVFDGTGASSISDPRRIYWSPAGSHPLFIADRGNNQVKAVSSTTIGVSVVRTDGQATGANLNHPESVTADLAGFFYLVDRDNRRVLRYDLSGEFIQRVDVELNADLPPQPLLDPVSIAVDDSLAYVADRGRSQIIRYQRRQPQGRQP